MNRSADVIVVGAGVIGLAIAVELSRRGARVRVIDARAAGQGATQASAGMLTPHNELHHHPALAALGVRSLDLYDPFIARLSEYSGVSVEYRRCGSLHVAPDDAAMEGLRQLAARLAEDGVASQMLTAGDVRAHESRIEAEIAGGLLVPSHGYVVVNELIHALEAAGISSGMRIDLERCVSVVREGAMLAVQTHSTGILRAPSVVLATGSWTSRVEVAGDVAVAVRPVRGQLVQLDWPTPPVRRIVWGPECYLVPWTNGTMLVGATVEEAGFDERATTAGVRDLIEAACELMPQAWQAAFAGVRVGLRPAAPDDLPVIGESSRVEGVYYATGHYRNGVLLAPVTAVMVADLVLGGRRDPALAAFSPARFA